MNTFAKGDQFLTDANIAPRFRNPKSAIRNLKFLWAHQDSNLGPRDYESPALTAEL
jgi:hypothetical protein